MSDSFTNDEERVCPPPPAGVTFTWTGRVDLGAGFRPWCAFGDGDPWMWTGADQGHWARTEGAWASKILRAAGQ